MPVLSKIKGIIIRMFYKDHPPPHIHAIHNETSGIFNIEKSNMIKGNLNEKDQKNIVDWMADKKELLMEMWNTQNISKID